MKVAELSDRSLRKRFISDELVVKTGPFQIRLGGNVESFVRTWQQCYGALELCDPHSTCHFRIRMVKRGGLRRLANRQQVIFETNAVRPFDPYPLSSAFPLYEWGLNWCIANTAHKYLLFHGAVLEKSGNALMMPASPGSGKTTLCAALVGRGWRLLSDEFGIYRHSDGKLLPLPRAAPLKNESIELIASTAPHLQIGPLYPNTRKGDVAHVFPPEHSLLMQDEPAKPRWIVFPRYENGASLNFTPAEPINAFQHLIHNSFNYRITGEQGFRSVCRLMTEVEIYHLHNGSLADAVSSIESLAQDSGP